MNPSTKTPFSAPDGPSFFSRVINNDATKKGAAAFLAGLLVGAISEALTSSSST